MKIINHLQTSLILTKVINNFFLPLLNLKLVSSPLNKITILQKKITLQFKTIAKYYKMHCLTQILKYNMLIKLY